MRMRRSRSAALVIAAGCVACALLLVGPRAQAAPPVVTSVDEAGWEGVRGVREQVSTAQRCVVLLPAPRLAAGVSAAGGTASGSDLRRWARAAQTPPNGCLP